MGNKIERATSHDATFVVRRSTVISAPDDGGYDPNRESLVFSARWDQHYGTNPMVLRVALVGLRRKRARFDTSGFTRSNSGVRAIRTIDTFRLQLDLDLCWRTASRRQRRDQQQ